MGAAAAEPLGIAPAVDSVVAARAPPMTRRHRRARGPGDAPSSDMRCNVPRELGRETARQADDRALPGTRRVGRSQERSVCGTGGGSCGFGPGCTGGTGGTSGSGWLGSSGSGESSEQHALAYPPQRRWVNGSDRGDRATFARQSGDDDPTERDPDRPGVAP